MFAWAFVSVMLSSRAHMYMGKYAHMYMGKYLATSVGIVFFKIRIAYICGRVGLDTPPVSMLLVGRLQLSEEQDCETVLNPS